MFKNDERYWDINLLNKWFAISSVVFLITMVWTFIDDNDDEFKEYQREFRKLEIEKAEEKLIQEKSSIEGEVEDYDKLLAEAENEYSKKSHEPKPVRTFKLFKDLESAVEKMNTPPVKRGKPARCHSLVQPKSAMIKPTYQTSQTVYKNKAPRRTSKLWQGAFRMSLPKKGCGFPKPIKKFNNEMRRNKKPRQASLKSTWRGMYTNVPLPVGTLMPTPWNSRSIIPT